MRADAAPRVPKAAIVRKESTVAEREDPILDLSGLQPAAVEDLRRRVQEIESGYRSIARKVGHLYMRADELQLDALTAQLDRSMLMAAANEQTFAALLDELRQQRKNFTARG